MKNSEYCEGSDRSKVFLKHGILQVQMNIFAEMSEVLADIKVSADAIAPQIQGLELLRINGGYGGAIAYVLASTFAGVVDAIAVYDSDKENEEKAYIVVKSSEKYSIGDYV